MTSKHLLIFSFGVLIFYGCNSDKKEPLVFSNDFESVRGWHDLSGVTNMGGHSGTYSLITDSNQIYSKTFKIKFRDISGKRIKGVEYTVWCYADALPVKGSVVASVRNDSVEQVMYNGNGFENFISEEKQWTKVSAKIDFAPHASDPENEFGFYIWNTGKNKILADDVVIRFIE